MESSDLRATCSIWNFKAFKDYNFKNLCLRVLFHGLIYTIVAIIVYYFLEPNAVQKSVCAIFKENMAAMIISVFLDSLLFTILAFMKANCSTDSTVICSLVLGAVMQTLHTMIGGFSSFNCHYEFLRYSTTEEAVIFDPDYVLVLGPAVRIAGLPQPLIIDSNDDFLHFHRRGTNENEEFGSLKVYFERFYNVATFHRTTEYFQVLQNDFPIIYCFYQVAFSLLLVVFVLLFFALCYSLYVSTA
uniref:Uncharacterized protein n=1 Tax=Panagrolaimus sp. JU765 TaxID=591449 RepID=A0AC34RMS4_9BILA